MLVVVMMTTMPMMIMMIVMMMMMAQWGLEVWSSETSLGQREWKDETRALIPKG